MTYLTRCGFLFAVICLLFTMLVSLHTQEAPAPDGQLPNESQPVVGADGEQGVPAEGEEIKEKEEIKAKEVEYIPITMVKINGQTYVTGGTIKGEMQLTASNSPYVFVGDIIIPPKATLTIAPGVIIKFGGDVIFPSQKPALIIKVLGSLKAIGSKGKSILFTTNEGTPSWGGITFDTSAKDCIMQFCELEAAASKITCSSAFVTIEDTAIRKDKKLVEKKEDKEAIEKAKEKEKKESKYSKYKKSTPKDSASGVKEISEPEEGGGCLGF